MGFFLPGRMYPLLKNRKDHLASGFGFWVKLKINQFYLVAL
jgi:hypothetical protein